MPKQTKTVLDKSAEKEEVLAGGSGKTRASEPWAPDYARLRGNENILKIPSVENMADVLANSNLVTDEERIAYLRIIRRLEKFGLTSRLQFIRQCLASTLGRRAFGKTLQLQEKIELIAPAVIREQLNMKQVGNKENVSKGSDIRPQNNNGSNNGPENNNQ